MSIIEEGVSLATMLNVPMRDLILLILMRSKPIESHPGAIFQSDELLTLEFRNF